MPRFICGFAIWLALTSLGYAACTPQTVAGLEARGVSAQLIAKMCGGTTGAGADPAVSTSNVCATNLGVCPYHGPVNSNCSCNGPAGPVRGIGR
jgi:hypothetical protein